MGYYDYRNYVTKVVNNRQIIFECDRGYMLSEGPMGKTCIRGEWAPKTAPPRYGWIYTGNFLSIRPGFTTNTNHIFSDAFPASIQTTEINVHSNVWSVKPSRAAAAMFFGEVVVAGVVEVSEVAESLERRIRMEKRKSLKVYWRYGFPLKILSWRAHRWKCLEFQLPPLQCVLQTLWTMNTSWQNYWSLVKLKAKKTTKTRRCTRMELRSKSAAFRVSE